MKLTRSWSNSVKQLSENPSTKLVIIKTSRYKLTGKEASGDDVNIDIWYNKDNWVKMIFLKDGSTIEYFLKEYDSKKE